MSVVEPAAPAEDPAVLRQQLDAANAALAAAVARPPRKPSRFKAVVSRIGRGIWAAVASTDAVRAEKNLAVLIATRLLISAGATDGLLKIVQAIIKAQGW